MADLKDTMPNPFHVHPDCEKCLEQRAEITSLCDALIKASDQRQEDLIDLIEKVRRMAAILPGGNDAFDDTTIERDPVTGRRRIITKGKIIGEQG